MAMLMQHVLLLLNFFSLGLSFAQFQLKALGAMQQENQDQSLLKQKELDSKLVLVVEVNGELDAIMLLSLELDQTISRNHYQAMVKPFQHFKEGLKLTSLDWKHSSAIILKLFMLDLRNFDVRSPIIILVRELLKQYLK